MAGLTSVLLLAGGAHAFPSIRTRIPNGKRVPCPEGVDGCDVGDASNCQPELVCNGVGHANCQGGSMPLNPFGQALLDAEFEWTTALCEADSDGDGLTNGQELGDPCCLWHSHDEPSEYMRNFSPTHPGMADSASAVASVERVTDCDSTTPTAVGHVLNQFNPGEVQLEMELRYEFRLPNQRTIYADMALNIPTDVLDAHDVYHAVFGTAIVDKVANLHHYVVRRCSQLWPEEINGRFVNRRQAREASCDAQSMTGGGNWGTWAPGDHVVDTPAWAGLPFGRGVGIVAFIVNVHWDNAAEESDIVDRSGIHLWFTPTLREHNIGDVTTSQISVNGAISIPAGASRWFLTRRCLLTVEDSESREPAMMHLTGVAYHAHLLGREMYAEYWPVGETQSIDLGSEPVWHFDDQSTRNIIDWNLTLQTGDILQTTCVMDSTGREDATAFGIETTDEMCWAWFKGWPTAPSGLAVSSCVGDVWSGILADGEPGLGLTARHPVDGARDVWDGSSLLTGGEPIRVHGRDISVVNSGCTDQLGQMCTMALTMGLADDPSFACGNPMGDLSSAEYLPEAIHALTVMEVCCFTACGSVCAQDPYCTSMDIPTQVPPPAVLGPESWADNSVRTMVVCGTNIGASSHGDSSSGQENSASVSSSGFSGHPYFVSAALALLSSLV